MKINLYNKETDKGYTICYTQCKPSIFLSNILILLEPSQQNFIGIPNHKIWQIKCCFQVKCWIHILAIQAVLKAHMNDLFLKWKLAKLINSYIDSGLNGGPLKDMYTSNSKKL